MHVDGRVVRARRILDVVAERGYSVRVEADLMAELHCSARTIRRDWNLGRRMTQRAMDTANTEVFRAEQVQTLREIQRKAIAKGDFTAAARAVDIEAKIIGTIAPVKVDNRHSGTVIHVPMGATPIETLATEIDTLLHQQRVLTANFVELPQATTSADNPAGPLNADAEGL